METPPDVGDMPEEAFRKYGHQLIDWIADHFEHIDQTPVLPAVSPGDITRKLPASAPSTGESMESIFGDIDTVIMPGVTQWNHPDFFAYFSITGSGPGILGDLLSTALNVNGMLWKTSPAATELEQVSLDWLRQLLGLPDTFWGIVYDTASVSSMHALASAREQLDLQIRNQGMAGRSDLPGLRVYTSDQAHSSIEKAAITLGFGHDNVVKIPSDDQFRMQPNALAEAIRTDRNKGYQPVCVVATVGTTSTTSIDPVPAIAGICREENIWLHVDAAYGGSAAVVPEMQQVLNGCEQADSLVVNPHKWLFVPIDFSAFYTRKPEILKRAFSLIPEYLRTSEDTEVENYMDYGIQLGRRFRSLKLWFVLRYFGRKGLADRIRYHMRLAQSVARKIEDHPSFELMAPVPFSTLCFRARPKGVSDGEDLNEFNERLLEAINDTREVFFSHTRLRGNYVIRMAIGNLRTTDQHVDHAWKIVTEKFEELAGQG